jgi:hypothetical protein
MSLSTVTVSGTWVAADNSPATGVVVVEPVEEVAGGGIIVAGAAVAIPLVAGAVNKALVSNTEATTLQYRVTERIDGAPVISYVITPTGDTLNLATAPRGTGGTMPLYLLASQRGASLGVAPLDGTSHIPTQYLPSGSGVLTVTAADGTVVVGGSSAEPTVAVGAIAESQVTNLATDLSAINTSLGGKAKKLVIRQGYVTSGNVTLPNTGSAWQALSGFELAIPAAVGDYVELGVNAMRKDATGNSWLDQAVIVGSPGSLVRYLSSGGSTPGVEGDPGWYVPQVGIISRGAPRGFVVTSDDRDGGNVRLVTAVKGNGTGILYASTDYPFFWRAINYGPVS